jgi:hypothetical protein
MIMKEYSSANYSTEYGRCRIREGVSCPECARRLKCLFYFTLRCLAETEDLGSAYLPDRAAAGDVAHKIARAFAVRMPDEGLDPALCVIEVADENHLLIQVVPLT